MGVSDVLNTAVRTGTPERAQADWLQANPAAIAASAKIHLMFFRNISIPS
jgi:hypothetical protein